MQDHVFCSISKVNSTLPNQLLLSSPCSCLTFCHSYSRGQKTTRNFLSRLDLCICCISPGSLYSILISWLIHMGSWEHVGFFLLLILLYLFFLVHSGQNQVLLLSNVCHKSQVFSVYSGKRGWNFISFLTVHKSSERKKSSPVDKKKKKKASDIQK